MNQFNQPPNKCQVYLNLGSPLSAISASYDQNKLIVAGRDIVKIVSLQGNEFKITSNLRAGKTQSLNYTGNDCCWHPSNVENYRSLVATAATNGAVVIWNLVRDGSKSVERVFSDHSRAVNKLAWHPDKLDCLLTGSQDNTLRFWDIRETANASKITFSPKSESIRDVQFNPYQSNQFAAAFDNGTIQLWDIRKPTIPVEKITSHQGLVLTIDWHPEERNIIASGGRDRAIRVWDFSTGRSLNNVSTISSVSRIKWRPGNKWHIASCSSIVDFNIHVWDVKKPYIPLFSFTDHRDVPTGLIWRSSTQLISCSKDSNLLLNEYNDAYKPYKHIRTTGISWNINNEIASINDKINRNQNIDNSGLLNQQQQQQYPTPMHASFFASFNVPTPPPLPPTVKVEQGIMNVYTPKYPNQDNLSDEKYVFEYYAKNYRFRGDSFNNLCQHNQMVSLQVKQYHISKVWSLLQLYFSHLDNLKPKDERESEEQLLQQQQQLKLIQEQKDKEKKEKLERQKKEEKDKQQQQQQQQEEEKEKEKNDKIQFEKDQKEIIHKQQKEIENNKEIEEKIKDSDSDDIDNNINSGIKFGSFGQINGGDVFDPSNDMMTAKEPPSSNEMMTASDSSNDIFNNLLSAEAVTPLVSLPIRAPSLDSNINSKDNNINSSDKKSSDNSNRRQKDDNNNNNIGNKNDKKNNSNNNNEDNKDNINNNNIDKDNNNNSIDNSNNNNNNNNNEKENKNNSKEKLDNNNSKNEKQENNNSKNEDLKILVPCFEFEEFDFQPILIDMLDLCIERGDVQTCVFIVLILNRYIDLNIDKNQLTRWFGSYIELLQRFKFWSLSLEIMKYCDDQTINQASKRHTTYISACSQCGKSIPQNSLLCEKCNRIASKCSICRLPVKGVYVWCQGCGHGGHLNHMREWFVDNKQRSCPAACSHVCVLNLK